MGGTGGGWDGNGNVGLGAPWQRIKMGLELIRKIPSNLSYS